MSERDDDKPGRPPDDRRARVAEALRANLRRRKAAQKKADKPDRKPRG